MYFWNMNIDIVAGTNIIISVGLCVDYSAHMAHSFLTKTGTGSVKSSIYLVSSRLRK
jgi:Niemann-Pick C1 protein